jgi:hypothetical protein
MDYCASLRMILNTSLNSAPSWVELVDYIEESDE